MLKTERLDFGKGEELRIARLGKGEPLILLHGYPGNLQIFSRLAPLLAQEYEVVAFDWPGMGYSPVWKGGTAPSQMAKRILKIMDRLEIERAHLMGQDMGGQPVLAFAAQHKKRLGKAIVMNSLVQWDAPTSWEIRLLRKLGFNTFALKHFPRRVFARVEGTFLPQGEKIDPEVRKDLWEAFRQRPVRDFIVRMCFGYEAQLPRLPKRYANIDSPLLILWGGKGKHFPLAHAEALAKQVPHAEMEVLENGWHWMVWQQPEEVAGKMLTFLRK